MRGRRPVPDSLSNVVRAVAHYCRAMLPERDWADKLDDAAAELEFLRSEVERLTDERRRMPR